MTVISGCAPAERTFAGAGKIIAGTSQFIEERAQLSTEPQLDPGDPMFWQSWQDNWGGN